MQNKMYLDLLKKVLTDYHRLEYGEFKPLYSNNPSWKVKSMMQLDKFLHRWNLFICRKINYDPEVRKVGGDWPTYADTMIGLKRLNNIEYCMEQILKDNIPGDVIETGVWRGGATIFMKAILACNEVKDRIVWVADSFEGLPEPDQKSYAADNGDQHHLMKELAVTQETVMRNFEKYGLLDEQVKFLKGWFKDTLPSSPIEKLSLLRLDGDMYESTMDALVSLYPKLSIGGYIIIDDWGAVPACKQAVLEYRKQHGIEDDIESIDWAGVYWRKSK